MAIDTIAITPGSGQLLDAVSMSNGTNTVDRELIVIGDPTTFANQTGVTAKGTQASFALGTQDLKDAGRSFFHLSVPVQTASSVTTPIVIANLTQNSNFTQTTGVTAFSIPSGKTLRIQQFSAAAAAETVTTVSTSKTCMIVQIRVATASTTAAIAAGVIVCQVDVPVEAGTSAGLISAAMHHTYPDGIDIPNGNAGGNFVGVTFNNAANAITLILLAASVVGFTY